MKKSARRIQNQISNCINIDKKRKYTQLGRQKRQINQTLI